MFALLKCLTWRDEALSSSARWFVMGQVCVAREFHGMGVVVGLCRQLRTVYSQQFDFTVTEISQRNPRSVRAHSKVGFETQHTCPHPATGEMWEVVVWDWRQ